MIEFTPDGSRPVARVFLFDSINRVLLLEVENPSRGNRFWVTPGGGLHSGETFEDAARRELREETGMDTDIGPCVLSWRHRFTWNGKVHDQTERYFFSRTIEVQIHPFAQDTCVIRHRWWATREVQTSDDEFVPQDLAAILAEILQGRILPLRDDSAHEYPPNI